MDVRWLHQAREEPCALQNRVRADACAQRLGPLGGQRNLVRVRSVDQRGPWHILAAGERARERGRTALQDAGQSEQPASDARRCFKFCSKVFASMC
eukprot:584463-Rhodomonas_salina.1